MKRRETTTRLDEIESSSSGKKERRKETAYIPPDIIEQIILRLPAKSVIRFRLVCKLWHAISSGASFVQKHLNFANKNPSLDLVFAKTKFAIYEKGVFKCDIWTPIEKKFPESVIVGCINGLVCMHENEKIVVFNPTTRESISLPNPSVTESYESRPINLGKWSFGFNPNSNEYKIVHFFFQTKEEIMQDGNRNYTDDSGCGVEVFTLGKDISTWRRIEKGLLMVPHSLAINISATMYWKVKFFKVDYKSVMSVLFFDLLDEKLGQIEAPKEDHCMSGIMDLNGRLCWISVNPPGQNRMMNLWILDGKTGKNNSNWTLLRAIELPVLICDINWSDLRLSYVPRNKLLIIVCLQDDIQIKYCLDFTIKNDSVEYVLSVPDHGEALAHTICPYVESLLPLP